METFGSMFGLVFFMLFYYWLRSLLVLKISISDACLRTTFVLRFD